MSMNPKPRRHYTPEFKAQAVELLLTGTPVPQLAAQLGISDNLLYAWRLDAQRAQSGGGGQPAAGGLDAADELRALRRELTRLRQENDILKKAAVILGIKNLPDSAP